MAAPVQVGLFGPNRVKVMVPVGPAAGGVATPPARVAVSVIGCPGPTGPDAWVTIVGVA